MKVSVSECAFEGTQRDAKPRRENKRERLGILNVLPANYSSNYFSLLRVFMNLKMAVRHREPLQRESDADCKPSD